VVGGWKVGGRRRRKVQKGNEEVIQKMKWQGDGNSRGTTWGGCWGPDAWTDNECLSDTSQESDNAWLHDIMSRP
jgi:hypothetical protein